MHDPSNIFRIVSTIRKRREHERSRAILRLVEIAERDVDLRSIAIAECLKLRRDQEVSPDEILPHVNTLLRIWKRMCAAIPDLQGNGAAERMDDESYRVGVRPLAAVLLDLMGYLPGPEVNAPLRAASMLGDPRLKLFAILSLLRRFQKVDPDEIERVAASDETRILLWSELRELQAEWLMPKCWAETEQLAVSAFVCWVGHPCELGHPPEDIEIKGRFVVEIGRQDASAYLLRFGEYPKPWLPSEGWAAGIAGPFANGEELRSPWSCFDPWDSMSGEEHFHKLFNPPPHAVLDSEVLRCVSALRAM